MSTYHVHLVDADRASRDGLARYFEAHGLTVTTMESAADLLRRPAFPADALDEVRRQGLARTDSSVVPGVGAMSAPVFDHRGELVLAITSIGPSAAFDTRWDGPVGQALRDAAQAVSLRLGHRPAPAGGG